MRDLIRQVGPCLLEVDEKTQPWQALVRAVAHQQLHGKAAEAIFGRFLDLYLQRKFPTPEEILATDFSALRGTGFSAAKVHAIRDIAEKAADGLIPTRAKCARMTDEEIIAACVPVRGVGQWTVEMLLIFTLGRPDVWPVDDFAIRDGYRHIYGLAEQPKPKALREPGERWAPWRSVASWYLWRAAGFAKEKKAVVKVPK